MHIRKTVIPSFWLALGLVSGIGARTLATPNHLTDPQTAAKLGLSVQQVHSLEAKFGLSNEELLAVPSIQMQLMLEDLDHLGIEKHRSRQQYQVLHLRDEHGQIDPEGLMRALEQRRHSGVSADLFPGLPDPSLTVPSFGTPGPLVAGITNGGWTWLGPGNIGGRVRAILIHPTAPNTLWCGGVDGGVWRTTNNGAAWFPLNDFMANLAISTMVMDPADPNTIYAGTGEAMYNADAIRGAGIFKTSDGGTTWTQLVSTANSSFLYVSRLTISPSNSLVLLASTRTGIYRSADGGATWSQRLAVEMLDVAFHPTDTNQAVCSGYNGKAYYSTDGGLSWTAATGLPAPTGFVVGRVEISYARSNPLTVYASMDNSNGEIYASGDGGHSYSRRSTGNAYLGAQGWYDNVIWVDPTSTNVLVVGGIDLWRSTDGGATLTRISQWQSAPSSAHADHHAIVSPANFNGTTVTTVYFGDDGGVYRAANVYTVSLTSGWETLNNNLGITQFYGGAGNAGSGTIVGGTQDNGDLRYTPGGGANGWTAMYGGDGGSSAADPTDANYFYGEYVYVQIHRSANGGSSATDIYSGITEAGTSSANFISPFTLDPNNANTMLAGGASLWRSLNVKAATPTWTAIKSPTSPSSPISAIAVANGNSDIIWVGHNSGDVYYTTNGTAGSPTWFQRDLGTPNLPNRYCGRIAIHPFNPSKVYVSFGGYNSGNIWRTTDSGLTWADISGNLPAAPVNAITIATAVTNTLYVGTDVGVYGTTADGTTWSTGNDGPANVAVDELFWMSNKLVAVTHGRGMFSITPALGSANLVGAGSAVVGGNGNGLVDPNECDQLNLVVQNVGGSSASNITATLTTTTPGVTIVQGSAAYPNLVSGGALASNSIPFQISTSPSITCGTPIVVSLNLSYNLTNVSSVSYTLPSGGAVYAIATSAGAALVPGTVDIGNHGDDVVTTISLPFSWLFYGQSVSNATLSSNGNLQFQSSDNQYNNVCLPYGGFSYAICPLWDDLRTDQTGGGIFTSTSGSAPNRIFNIEWRANYYSGNAAVNFEVRLYEGQSRFDIIYGTVNGTGSTVTVGIQSDTGSSSLNYECNAGGLSDGLQLTFQAPCTDGGGGCSVGPVANFNASPLAGAVPLSVGFVNQSSGATNYSWTFGDGNSSSVTNPVNVYTLAGNYSVTLSAIGNGSTNTLTRTNYILVTNVPPGFAASPTNQSLAQGANAAFAVSATGSTPLSYAWRFGGTPIAGATLSAYTRPNVQCGDAGGYDVVVTNIGGSATSSVALLTVVSPPVVLAPPTNQTVVLGQAASFSVIASNNCGGGLTYQWRHAGSNLAGATASAFALASAQTTNAGAYAGVITNLGGALTSTVATLTVVIPPGITSSPTNQLLAQGTNVVFAASATGSAPLSYAWRFGGVTIAGATDSAYTRTNVQCSDAGGYDVVVTNAVGSVTSSVALLTVVSAPLVLAPPTNQTVVLGQAAGFSVTANNSCGGGLTYQWQHAGTNLAGATSSAIAIANAQTTNAGAYLVVITNLAGVLTSAVATLTVVVPPGITSSPTNQLLAQGTNAVFVVSATGGAPLSYAWWFGGVAISGATDSSYTRTNIQCSDVGGYDVVVTNGGGSVTSSVALLTVVSPPVVLAPPTNQTVVLGQAASFSVAASNNCGGGLTYQWQHAGTNLVGATASAFVLANAQTTNAGAYAAVITNLGGMLTSAVATLTVVIPPGLASSPTNLLLAQGTSAGFAVSATGTAPLSYAWRFGGVTIAGATDSAYTRTNVQCGDVGSYDVLVTNGGGSVTSSVALLTVVSAPVVVSPPTNQTVVLGQAGGFSVTASNDCGGGLTYQWQHAGTNLVGATMSALVIANAQSTDAGAYGVVITNLGGALTSSVATLTVIIPPRIASSPTNQLLGQGVTAVFSVNATGSAPLSYAWRFGGVTIAGATESDYTGTNVQCSEAGSYDVVVTNAGGSVTSGVAMLEVVAPPVILASPTNQAVLLGQSANLSVTATNDCGGGLAYQWQLAGTNLQAATTSNLLLTNVDETVAGAYAVVISTMAGSVTSGVATLTVMVPPVIGAGPSGQIVSRGTDTLLSVSASGSAPLSYEWRFGGAAIADATDSAYTHSQVQCSDAGAYDVIVSNAAGSVTSGVAVITVVAPPVVVTDPVGQTVVVGQALALSVEATNDCGGGLTYQWRLNQGDMLDATNSVFLRTNAQLADSGSYTVVVTNLAGAITSSVATVLVGNLSQLIVSPTNLDFGPVFAGSAATGSLVVSNAGFGPLSGSATVLGGPFTINGGNEVQLVVPAFGSTNLVVQFAPLASSVFSNAIAFATDGGGATNNLNGLGVDLPAILSPRQSGTNLVFSFITIPGKTYVIEYTDGLDSPAWLPLQTIPGDGTTHLFEAPSATPSQRFYRLRAY